MPYISLYRKYRSQSFGEVMGQEHVTRTLQNAIKSGKIGHAYLFCGSRGTGKTTVARLLAKAVNCERGPTPDPCNECEACRSIADGSAVDVIELDAASHRSVDDVDNLREGVKYPPMRLRYKVYVIDEAHQLSSTAKDAFLKTLEEPPPHAIFVLATTEAHQIPLTIRSRCQQFDFRRGSVTDITERLRFVIENEGREADHEALDIVARSAQGSWRDALSLLEQVLSYTDERMTVEHVNTVLGTVDEEVLYQVSDVVAREDAAAAFELAGRLLQEGKDVRELMKAVAGHFRDLLAASVGAGSGTGGPGDRAAERAAQFTRERLVSLVETFAAADKDLRYSDQHRLALEMALLKSISRPAPAPVREAPAAPAARPAAAQPAAPEPRPKTAPPAEVKSTAGPTVTPVSVPRDGDVTVDQVRRAWPRVLGHVNDVQRKKGVGALLREAEVMAVQNGTVYLGYGKKWKLHLDSIQKPENTEVVTTAIAAVLGVRVGLKAVVSEPEEPELVISAEVEPDVPPPAADDGGMVHEVLEMFGGEVAQDIDSERNDIDIDDENYDPWKEP